MDFTSSDSTAALPTPNPLSNGVGVFSATLATLGTQTLTATDSVTSAMTAVSAITVNTGAVSHFSFDFGSFTIVAGYPDTMTVVARDQFNNIITSYSGTVQFTSTDGAAVLPPNSTLTNGTGVFSVTFNTPGNQSVTGTDTVTGVSGTSGLVTVTGPALDAVTHFGITGMPPGGTTAGTAVTLTVTALDANNNTVTTYNGSVGVSSSDSKAVLPVYATLTNGVGVFTATFETAGNPTVTVTGATDTASYTQAPGSPFDAGLNLGPYDLVAGDFTGNGKQDLAIATYAGTVEIFLGNGDGTFKAGVTLPISYIPYAIVDADFRNNGILDLAVLNGNDVTVFLGNGDGTFAAGVNYDIDTFSAYSSTGLGLSVGDFNGDGNLDLLVSGQVNNLFDGDFSILYGRGNGTFATSSVANGSFQYYGAELSGIAVGNFDSTGNLDFALTDPLDGTTTVALGNGTGGFSGASAYGVTGAALVVGNFNGNANPEDIAVLQDSAVLSLGLIPATQVTILTGNGNGSFAVGSVYPIPWLANDLVVADANADGSPDILEVNSTGNNVGVLLGNGNGTFGNGPTFGVGDLPTDLAVADFTGDGAPDLAVVNFSDGTVSILLHQTVSGSAAVSIVAAAPNHFLVTAPPGATPGSAFTFTVTAQDTFGNTTTSYNGTVRFSSSDASAGVPTPTAVANGIGTFTATLQNLGTQTITVTDTANSALTGTSGSISVSNPAAQFSIVVPGSATAGAAFSITVTALDASFATATGYTGTVKFTSSDTLAVLPANATLTDGIGVFSVTLCTAGSQTITATDTQLSTITATSGGINVSAATATHLALSLPASATAGGAFIITVTALDQFGNTDTNFSAAVDFTSSDAGAVFPTATSLSAGVGTFSAMLTTSGLQSVAVSAPLVGITSSASSNVTVNPAPASHFVVTAPGTAIPNGPIILVVTALDSFDNTVTNYSGTVRFTSTDGLAALPANSTLTKGVGLFSVTLKTTGNQTVTVTDSGASALNGTSSSIAVNPGAVQHFLVSSPSAATVGSAFIITVTAQDQFFNTATSYTGTVHFSSTDSAATLPADATFTNGVGVFSVTLKTSGSQLLMVADSVLTRVSGLSVPIAVSNAATHFSVTVPAASTAGNAFVFVVTALDQSNNPATSYSGTVHFTSSDAQAYLPATATITGGVGFFAAVLKTAGNQTITVADTASRGGTSTAVSVSPAAATHFSLTGITNAVTGIASAFTVEALDPYNNVAPTYAGTVHFTSSDAAATLPNNGILTAGVGVFHATLMTPGSNTISATDTVAGTITGTSPAITTRGLTVAALTPTTTGFVATFDKPFVASDINLYDSTSGGGIDDVLLTGPGARRFPSTAR